MPTPLRAMLLARAALASPAAAAPEAVEIAFDPDVSFDYDRAEYERGLRGLVDRSFAAAAAGAGLSLERPLRIAVYTTAHYEREFGAGAAWNQGARYYRRAVYVNGGSRLDDWLAGTLVHEITHALLDARGTGHLLPTWLNEGFAERLAWQRKGLDSLQPNQVSELQVALRGRRLTPLPAVGGLSRFGYLQSYAAALFLETKHGRGTLLAVVRRTLRGEPFEKALDAETRWRQEDLEREFVSWIEHL